MKPGPNETKSTVEILTSYLVNETLREKAPPSDPSRAIAPTALGVHLQLVQVLRDGPYARISV